MRCRIRCAVSGLLSQIGLRTASTSPDLTSPTGLAPRMGKAKVSQRSYPLLGGATEKRPVGRRVRCGDRSLAVIVDRVPGCSCFGRGCPLSAKAKLMTMEMPIKRCLMNLRSMLGLMVTKPTVTRLAPVRNRDSMAHITPEERSASAVNNHFEVVQAVLW